MVGPAALGEQVQNDWHQFIGIGGGQGWDDQLKNEPGLAISATTSRWRLEQSSSSAASAPISCPRPMSPPATCSPTAPAARMHAHRPPSRRRLRSGAHPPGALGRRLVRRKSFDGCSGFDCLGYLRLRRRSRAAPWRAISSSTATLSPASRMWTKKPLVGDLTGGVLGVLEKHRALRSRAFEPHQGVLRPAGPGQPIGACASPSIGDAAGPPPGHGRHTLAGVEFLARGGHTPVPTQQQWGFRTWPRP